MSRLSNKHTLCFKNSLKKCQFSEISLLISEHEQSDILLNLSKSIIDNVSTFWSNLLCMVSLPFKNYVK